jgi:fructose-bisphosphate aldolase/2-amino-3,7-dideoxy-D-threo-hept-6-ulosonate synthase
VVIGSSKELEMLKKLGNVAALCREKGIPLLAEMLLSKNKIENKNVKTIARIGAELGADIIKTYYTGDLQSFKEVIDGCPVPIVILGGKVKSNLEELFESVKDAIEAGASGIAFGRNIWMNENPNAVLESLRKIIHGRHIP